MNNLDTGDAALLFQRGVTTSEPSCATAIPPLSGNHLEMFSSAMAPLVQHLREAHGTNDGVFGAMIGSSLPWQVRSNTLFCDVTAETHYSRDLEKTRRAFRDIAAYGKLIEKLQHLTIEIREGVDVTYPHGGAYSYCVFRIMTSSMPGGSLLADYVHGIVEFLKLERHLGKPTTYNELLIDRVGLRSLESAWARLLPRRSALAERRQEVSNLLDKLSPRMLMPYF